MNDDRDRRLDQALADLPRIEPGPEFTRRAVERLDGADAIGRTPPLAWALGAVGAAAVLALTLWIARTDAPEPTAPVVADQGRVERLRAEHRRLSRELAELRAAAESEAPVVYLDGGEGYDLVVDLRPLADGRYQRAGGPALAADDRSPGGSPRRPR